MLALDRTLAALIPRLALLSLLCPFLLYIALFSLCFNSMTDPSRDIILEERFTTMRDLGTTSPSREIDKRNIKYGISTIGQERIERATSGFVFKGGGPMGNGNGNERAWTWMRWDTSFRFFPLCCCYLCAFRFPFSLFHGLRLSSPLLPSYTIWYRTYWPLLIWILSPSLSMDLRACSRGDFLLQETNMNETNLWLPD